MHLRRVVITGMGTISPFGAGIERLFESLLANRSSVSVVPELTGIEGLRTRVAALVPGIDPKEIPRKFRRSMSTMSIYATLAAQEAIAQGGVTEKELQSGDTGVAIGSTVGSPIATQEFYEAFLPNKSLETTRATFFFQIMNHSCASNVAQVFGISGRMLAPSAACSTGCQAIGYGYEMIAYGKQERMLCGGADEFHPLTAAVFDILNASSVKYNERPTETPRPFDRDRDGVVCGEGSGILILESLDSAKNRNAPIMAEVMGFATLTDTTNIADPNANSIETCIRKALSEASIAQNEIDYINAHATGTLQGDIAESEAIRRIFGDRTSTSGLKGHLGHTMAASGAIETIATIMMMQRGRLIPTLHLDSIDPLCQNIGHLQEAVEKPVRTILKNNFALGGINSCLILRRYEDDGPGSD
jgi:3-oxoacyl-[acyl-carrier-protein] synthase II